MNWDPGGKYQEETKKTPTVQWFVRQLPDHTPLGLQVIIALVRLIFAMSFVAHYSKKSKKKQGRKLHVQKVKDCDPNSLETVFKKKKNRKTKHKNRDKLMKNISKVETRDKEVPSLQSPESISSNWKNLLKNLPKEDEGAKPKTAFVRRNKKGQLITNQQIKHPKAVQIGQKKKIPVKARETHEDDDDVWFDDVDPMLLESDKAAINANNTPEALVKVNGFTGVTKILGMDCEMVGVGVAGTDSILARVSIVNHFGHKVYDKFVAPREKVCPHILHSW